MYVKIQIGDNMLWVRFSYFPAYEEKIKQISGYKWNSERRCWTIPYTKENINRLFKTFSGAYIEFNSDYKSKPKRSQKTRKDSLVKRLLYLLVK